MNNYQGSETLLVVEDESSLRKLLSQALREKGYQVLEAEHSEEAHRIWETRNADIDLVITDIVLPGDQNGWELAKELLLARPGLKILFMSGYFGTPPADLKVDDLNFLRKPFLPRALLECVSSLLNRA